MTGSDFHPKLEAMNKLIQETFPPHNFEAGGKTHSLKYDLELVCHELLGDLELEKTVKRDLSKRVVFKKSDGKMYEIKPPKGAPSDWQAKMIAAVKSKHGIAKTINEMTLAEAVAEYKAA